MFRFVDFGSIQSAVGERSRHWVTEIVIKKRKSISPFTLVNVCKLNWCSLPERCSINARVHLQIQPKNSLLIALCLYFCYWPGNFLVLGYDHIIPQHGQLGERIKLNLLDLEVEATWPYIRNRPSHVSVYATAPRQVKHREKIDGKVVFLVQ